jgi:DDE superfamily endonuclease
VVEIPPWACASKSVAFIEANAEWLTVFQLPAYAPDLNPQEGIWSLVKREIGNLAAAGLTQITTARRPNSASVTQYSRHIEPVRHGPDAAAYTQKPGVRIHSLGARFAGKGVDRAVGGSAHCRFRPRRLTQGAAPMRPADARRHGARDGID